ncbi:MAG: DUF4129 domain-containing protein [Actinomycetia bacterium]|nr:DUF4129 domain-containing protein [Actinomycetes bacterium]
MKQQRWWRQVWSRTLIVVGFVAAWLVVMLVGAGGGEPDRDLGVPDFSTVITTVFAVMLGLGAVIIILAARGGNKPTASRRKGTLTGLLIVILFALALNQLTDPAEEAEPEPEEVAPVPTTAGPPLAGDRPDDASDRQLVTLVLVGAAILVAALVVSRGRHAHQLGIEETADDPATVVAAGLAMTAQRLRDEPDPRRAVLLAFAGLEEALGRTGHDRLAAETPHEYTTRILRSVEAEPRPVQLLSALYHDARFSDRPISRADQEQAADAFDQAHTELRSRTLRAQSQ